MTQELQAGSRLAGISGDQDHVPRPRPGTTYPPALRHFPYEGDIDEHAVPCLGKIASDNGGAKGV